MGTKELKLAAKIFQKIKFTEAASYFNNVYYDQLLKKLDGELSKAEKRTLVNNKNKNCIIM